MDWRSNPKIALCVQELFRGGVIAYPTEAVWGLGCDPFSESAVQRLLELKGRPVSKGLILVAGEIEQLDFLLEGLPSGQLNKLKGSWPGHTTWLVPHHNRVSSCIFGRFDTVAVRISRHPIIQALCSRFGGPIVSTSANLQGMRPAMSAMSARRYFLKSGILFCPGRLGDRSSPSVIKDLKTNRIIRA